MTASYAITISFGLLSAVLWAQSDATKATSENRDSTPGISSSSSSVGTQPTPNPPDSTKLEIIHGERSVYPLAAAEKQLQGQVWLRLHITVSGDVNEVDVLSGDPILAQAAVSAGKKWKFKPYIKNGHAVPVLYKMPMDFAFRGKVTDMPVPAQPVESSDPNKSPGATPVAGSTDSAAGGDAAQKVKRVRVSQGVSKGLLLHKVQPIYPLDARRNRVQGVVVLEAVIDTVGRIYRLQVISGPKELISSAVGAVEQWRYRPYLLEGEPVEVQTQIVVNFELRSQ
jgi:TonB family protein